MRLKTGHKRAKRQQARMRRMKVTSMKAYRRIDKLLKEIFANA